MKKQVTIFLLQTCFLHHLTLSQVAVPIVNTTSGPVRGTFGSALFSPYYAYLGIPYAKPPIHDRRFEPPEPMDKWTEVFNATAYGPVCPQASDLGYENMSEDCLTLNIFTRKAGNSKVFVFINGDAFNEGAAMDVGPEYMLDLDCVLVTLNYRMNVFGFLSTGTSHAPGNVGLKDQAMALHWIFNNIGEFGGHRYTITLIGHGAGAMAASLHFVSPMAISLFQRMILMSGSALSHNPLKRHNMELVNRQAEMVGCSNDDVGLMMKCLKRVDFRKLAEGYRNLTDWSSFPYKTWFPVIEKDFGQKRYLEEDPIFTYRQKKVVNMPILIGVTRNETGFMAKNIVSNDSLFQDFNKNFNDIAPICFLYEKGTIRSQNISSRLRQRFFSNGVSQRSLENIFSDSHIRFAVYRTIDLLVWNQEHLAIRVYQSSYRGRFSHASNSTSGVYYGDDLQFLFPLKRYNITYTAFDPELIMIRNYTQMWFNFANTANPVPAGNNPPWPTYAPHLHIYMDISEVLELRSDFPEETIKFWDEMFPLDPIYHRFDYRHPEFWSLMTFISIGLVILVLLTGLTARLYYVRYQYNLRSRTQSTAELAGEQNDSIELEDVSEQEIESSESRNNNNNNSNANS